MLKIFDNIAVIKTMLILMAMIITYVGKFGVAITNSLAFPEGVHRKLCYRSKHAQ